MSIFENCNPQSTHTVKKDKIIKSGGLVTVTHPARASASIRAVHSLLKVNLSPTPQSTDR